MFLGRATRSIESCRLCPATRGLTPLLMAAEEGHSEVVALLLKFGASLEATDDSGSGPS